MIYVCVICMVQRPPLSPMEAEYRRLLEAILSPFIKTEQLKASHCHWLLCTSCKLFMQTVYNFQQTALVGVKRLQCLLRKLETQTIEDTTSRVTTIKIEPRVSTTCVAPKEEFHTVEAPTIIEDTTPRVTTIKIEPHVSTVAPKEEFHTVEAPTNVNPLAEEIDLKFERWPPESEHVPELQDCESDSTRCASNILPCPLTAEDRDDCNTNVPNIGHLASISAPSIQPVRIPKMDATAGSDGSFEVFTHKPQQSQEPRRPNIRQRDGGIREGPKKRIRNKARAPCPHCGKSVLCTSLKLHISGQHAESPCKCDVCGKLCRSAISLKSHMYRHLRNENAKTIDDMDPEAFCQECAVQYSSRSAYRVHLTTLKHIPRDQYQFECETCKLKFLDGTRLQQHVDIVHLGQRNHKCDQCDKCYGDASSLRKHVKCHEKRPNPRKHVCHLCGKSFTIRKCMEEHLLTHEGLRPHQCPLCPATFTYKAALYTHNKLKHLKIKGKWKKKKKVAEKEGKPEEEKADSND